MNQRIITAPLIESFSLYLLENEKSPATIDKYVRDVTAFMNNANGSAITKDLVIA